MRKAEMSRYKNHILGGGTEDFLIFLTWRRVSVSGSGPTCSVLMCLSPTDQWEQQDGGRTPREEGGDRREEGRQHFLILEEFLLPLPL